MKRPRILWIDIAKGLALLCTIIGHCVTFESDIYYLIHSFHMPLFFLVAGVTFSTREVGMLQSARKDFRRLVLPIFLVCMIQAAFTIAQDPSQALTVLKSTALSLLWGNGIAWGPFPGLGYMWFLVAMFWARQVYRYLLNAIPEYRMIFILFGAFASMFIGSKLPLPQCLDLVFVIIFFMEVGRIFRISRDVLPKAAFEVLGVACFAFWIYLCLYQDILIELASRTYPFTILSLLVCAAGAIAVSQAILAVETLPICKPLAFLGKHSLELLCIHALDGYVKFLWDAPALGLPGILTPVLRTAVNVLALCLWVLAVSRFQNRRKTQASCT